MIPIICHLHEIIACFPIMLVMILFVFFPFYINIFIYKWLMLAFISKNYFVMVYITKRQHFFFIFCLYAIKSDVNNFLSFFF
jgi:hypothetical protein